MDTVKTRKQGDAVVVLLASKFEVLEDKTYYITKELDGTILLIPRIEDYYAPVKEKEFVDAEDGLARSFEVGSKFLDD